MISLSSGGNAIFYLGDGFLWPNRMSSHASSYIFSVGRNLLFPMHTAPRVPPKTGNPQPHRHAVSALSLAVQGLASPGPQARTHHGPHFPLLASLPNFTSCALRRGAPGSVAGGHGPCRGQVTWDRPPPSAPHMPVCDVRDLADCPNCQCVSARRGVPGEGVARETRASIAHLADVVADSVI